MSWYLKWIILSAVLGGPVRAAVVLVVLGFIADRYTYGVLPDPVRFIRRRLRARRLQADLQRNPHDRRARAELADLLTGRKRYAQAMELLRFNIEAGDEDANTLYLMGVACLGSGHAQQGEVFLDAVESASPGFRYGQTLLERGRWRLARGDDKGAVESLEAFCKVRSGSVEGKVLLARAHQALGEDVKAAYLKRDAWKDYAAAPRFQRRKERFWAWRAQPQRPATIAFALILAVVLLGKIAGPSISDAVSRLRPMHNVDSAADDNE